MTTSSTPVLARKDPLVVRVIEKLARIAGGVGVVAAILLVLIILVDVTGRYVFNRSLPGTLDFVTFWFMPILVLFAYALTELRGEHVSVDLLTNGLTGTPRKIVYGFAAVLALAGVTLLTYFSFVSAFDSVKKQESAISVTWLPVWPIKLVVLIGLVIFILQLLVTLWRVLFNREKHRAEAEELEELLEGSAV